MNRVRAVVSRWSWQSNGRRMRHGDAWLRLPLVEFSVSYEPSHSGRHDIFWTWRVAVAGISFEAVG